jgi:UDP-GlcNAc3NAcA epimerase
MRLVTIVGARPQFVKAAMVSRAIRHHNRSGSAPRIREILVHTGQHYDYLMSRVFFENMGIAVPDHNLRVGSGSHAWMIGTMLPRIERVLLSVRPDGVLVYGDTNSTLAGALAAAKLPVPIAHVEAGMRSGNRMMPEEMNRRLTDHISSTLFCSSQTAVDNLRKEGITGGVYRVGDVMYDAFLAFEAKALRQSDLLKILRLCPGGYCLATVHRQENTDDPRRLRGIFRAFDELATPDCPVVIPLHPRTRLALAHEKRAAMHNRNIRLIPPVHYLDMIALETQARAILTDSGGIQKEAFFAGVPCVTLRDETEWGETVEAGWNVLAGAETSRILGAFAEVIGRKHTKKPRHYYGDGTASRKIVKRLAALCPLGPPASRSAGKKPGLPSKPGEKYV